MLRKQRNWNAEIMTEGKKQSKMERGNENEEEDKSNSLGMTGTETLEMTTAQHT